MGLITRGIKAGSGTTAFVDGAGKTILAAEVNYDLDTAYTEVNGNLETTNLKAAAGIKGGQIASKPNGLDSTNINNDAVTATELKDDATGVAGAVTTDHIRTDAVTKAKIAAANVTKDKLTTSGETVAFSYATVGFGPTIATIPIVGTYPKATYDILVLHTKTITVTSGTVLTSLFADDAGANWVIKIMAMTSVGGATVQGSVVVSFIQKT